jgi:hypothetical protein
MIQVQEYFNCHLQRKCWQQLSENEQVAAVKMAEIDIMLALGSDTLDIGDLLVFCAVCEQALFLADQVNKSAAGGILKSESIEGIGKREYFENKSAAKSSNGILSPRSELFLSRLPGYGVNRLSRG